MYFELKLWRFLVYEFANDELRHKMLHDYQIKCNVNLFSKLFAGNIVQTAVEHTA